MKLNTLTRNKVGNVSLTKTQSETEKNSIKLDNQDFTYSSRAEQF